MQEIVRLERKRESARKYRQSHKSECKESVKLWKNKNNQKWKEFCRRYYSNNSKRIKYCGKKYREKIRLEVFKLLGNKCSNQNCLVTGGCRDIRCLQIDHVNGGGLKERHSFSGSKYASVVLSKIRSGSKEYQLLCANCNWIKKHENGEV